MNNQLFLKTQVIDLEHMLEEAKDDPVLGRQLEQRIRAAKTTLQEETPDATLFPPVTPELPRAAVFFRGGGVEGLSVIPPEYVVGAANVFSLAGLPFRESRSGRRVRCNPWNRDSRDRFPVSHRSQEPACGVWGSEFRFPQDSSSSSIALPEQQ